MEKTVKRDSEKRIKLPESELKVMQFIWDNNSPLAKTVAAHMLDRVGWKKNTTYTVIKKLIFKGFVRRGENEFACIPLIERTRLAESETLFLLDEFYQGSVGRLIALVAESRGISQEDRAMIVKTLEMSK